MMYYIPPVTYYMTPIIHSGLSNHLSYAQAVCYSIAPVMFPLLFLVSVYLEKVGKSDTFILCSMAATSVFMCILFCVMWFL